MKNFKVFCLMAFLVMLITVSSNAQCSDETVSAMVEAVNKYRESAGEWKPVPDWAKDLTLVGTKPEHKGTIDLPVNNELAHSASETAKKFANGTYKGLDHVQNGVGYFRRAIENGWTPSLNKLFKADEGNSEMTGVLENLAVNGGGKDHPWTSTLEGWKKSQAHNRTILSRAATGIGIGCANVDAGNVPKNLSWQRVFWVLLVEVEEQAGVDDDAYFAKNFKEGVFYKAKQGMKDADKGKHTAEEHFEIIDGALDSLRKK